MTCETGQAELSALADGELALEAAAEVQRHLEACQACAGAYSESLRVREMADAWTIDAPDVSARVQSAIAADEQRLLISEIGLLRREMEDLRAEVSSLRRRLERRADALSWSPPRRTEFPKDTPRMENDPWNLTRS